VSGPARRGSALEPSQVRAAVLAALAEAGVVALPLHLILSESRALDLGVGAFALPFPVAYTTGVLLAVRFRRSASLASGVLVIAALAGLLLGEGDVNRSVFTVVVALLVALRVLSLALRDWGAPIEAEIGWGAVALGAETFVAAGAEPGWRPLLVLFVPLFFVATLASRATTVWSSGGVVDLDEHVRSAWIRRTMLATGGLLFAMGTAVVLSIRGGLFDRIGSWLSPVAAALAALFAAALGHAARPVFWLVDRLGIDPEAVRRFFERLRQAGLRRRIEDELGGPGTSLWQRLLGLLAFAAIAYALYRVLRRLRPPGGAPGRRRSGGTASVPSRPLEDAVAAPRPRLRRELPTEAVRRMYAEALLALRARELVKEPAATPAEFAPAVAGRFPEVAEAFGVLTRAYEDVRYGGRRPEASTVEQLGVGHARILAALGRRERR